MKKINLFYILFFGLFLGGCRPSPQTFAEKYMALVCTDNRLNEHLIVTQSEEERVRLQAKSAKIRKQMEKLNAQILAKYQENEQAMEVIRHVAENYQCQCKRKK